MKTINIGLSPNTQLSDSRKALENIFSPVGYRNGTSIKILEQWFRNYFGVSYAISFNSGRSALYAILKTLGVGKKDEVILQAFTCVVVPNAIVSLGAKPIYADITSDLTMDPKDLQKKITTKTKAILVQHTFGIPSHMEEIQKIAEAYKIPIIEDCAHTLGGTYNGKKLGTVGDISFFSFGRDKPFSSVFGGVAITRNQALGKTLRNFQKNLQYPPSGWIVQQLMHPVMSFFVLPAYDFFKLGKAFLFALQNLNMLSFPVSEREKKGIFNPTFVKKFPNALASLALMQLKKVKEYNETRERIGQIYIKNLNKNITIVYSKKVPLLRFPVLTDHPKELVSYLRKNKVYVGRWYSEVIDPAGTDLNVVSYKKGDCAVAEKMAEKIVNLPTLPTMSLEDAERIVKFINEYADLRNTK